MKELLQNLQKLQALDFSEIKEKGAEGLKAELRGRIPAPVLDHYDRLVVRGKKGLAVVRNQVCGGCHMRLPIGVIMTLMQAKDIQLCDNCGRYLVLETPAPAEAPQAVAPAKPARKPRKRKAVAVA